MTTKLCVSRWKVMLCTPSMILAVFMAPFLFYFVMPGFQGPNFPAILMLYVAFALGVNASRAGGEGASRLLMPVTQRQVVMGRYLFLFTGVLFSLAAALLTALVMGPAALTGASLLKALGASLVFAALTAFLQDRIPDKVHQVVTMVLYILVLNLTMAHPDGVFLPVVSLPVAVLLGAVAFPLFLALSLLLPETRPAEGI